MVWKILCYLTNNDSPVVVVMSESMEPAFRRHDILSLTMFDDEPITVGDIMVYKVRDNDIPIVHRVIKVHEKRESMVGGGDGSGGGSGGTVSAKSKEIGNLSVLTKGDNNDVHDRGLYRRGHKWLRKSEFIGRVKGHAPGIGCVTLKINDYPILKFLLIGSMIYFAIMNKDDD